MMQKSLFTFLLMASLNASAALNFSDDFSSGNLSRTGDGFAWTGSTRTSVSSKQLNFPWPANTAMTEQRFTLGATQYRELWIKYDLTVSPDYSHKSGNNKGFITLWSNTSGTATDDGYGATTSTDMLIGTEFNPNANNDGGSSLALRVENSTTDYNASNPTLWPNAIAVADRGKTRQIIMHIKASTIPPLNNGQGQFWWPSDGKFQVWKDGVLVANKTDANLYKAGWPGINRGYIFGWRNGTNAVSDYLTVANFQISTTDLWGVSGSSSQQASPPAAPALVVQPK